MGGEKEAKVGKEGKGRWEGERKFRERVKKEKGGNEIEELRGRERNESKRQGKYGRKREGTGETEGR